LGEVEAAGLLDGGFGVCAFGGCTSVFLFLGKEGVFFSFLAGGLFFLCGFGFSVWWGKSDALMSVRR
jgi:hypothetical protein